MKTQRAIKISRLCRPAALAACLLAAAAPLRCAEFEVLDKLAVNGSALLKSSVTVNAMAAPAVSPAAAGTLYFDSTANKFRVSQNAGNYVNLIATGTANYLTKFTGDTVPNFAASLIFDNGTNVGIGDATPASLFTVGSGDLFQVDLNGDLVRVKNIAYGWPGAQGGADTYLRNNGSGALTWQAVAAGAGDNLGTHIATQTLNMAGFGIVNVASITVTNFIRTSTLTVIAPDTVASSLWVSTSATTPHLYVSTNGNVGIGTASPVAKLHVVGMVGASGAESGFRWGDAVNGSTGQLVASAGDTYLDFFGTQHIRSLAGGLNERMTVLGTGNVGISSATPSYRLVVSSGAGETGTVMAVSTGATNLFWVAGDGAHAVKFFGDGSGLSGVSGSDNLGNHVATTTLQMGAYGIITSSAITAARYQINGSTVLAILPGVESVAVGPNTGGVNTGNYSVFVGSGAGAVNTTGAQNSLVGHSAGYSNTTGAQNTFVGYSAGFGNTTGWYNTFLGVNAGYYNTAGQYNSFVGDGAGLRNTTGSNNSILGYYSGYYNQTGSGNLIAGYYAGGYGAGSVNSFSNSTVLGYQAGYNMAGGANDNILLGWQAGYNITAGTGNIIIGYNKNTSAAAANNELNIGGVLYGNLSARTIGISTRTPYAALDIVSTGTAANIYAQIWRNGSGTIVSSMTSQGTLYATLPPGTGDNLGNHTAALALNMGNNAVDNVSSVTITGTGVTGSDPLFKVAGSTMVVLNNGNVGIGTVSPNINAYPSNSGVVTIKGNGNTANSQGVLELASSQNDGSGNTVGIIDFDATGTGPVARLSVKTSGSTANNRGATLQLQTKQDGAAVFNTGLFMDNAGNVGIGTTNPLHKLDVQGASANLKVTATSGNAGLEISGALGQLYNDVGDLYITNGSAAGSLILRTNTATEGMRITSTGNVGIGTASPGAKLHISSAGIANTLTTNIKSGIPGSFSPAQRVGLGSVIGFLNDGGFQYAQIGAYCGSDCTNNQSQLGFWTEGTATAFTTSNPKMVIDSVGNVGISTGAPQAALDIVGDGSTVLLPRKSTAGDPASPANGMIYYNANTGKFRCYQAGAWTDCVTSASGDNLGNHTATTDLNMASQAIFNASSMTITGAGVSGASPIFTVAGSTLNILANGNVGIGTTAPDDELHVVKDEGGAFGAGTGIMIENPDTDGLGGASALRLMRAGATKWGLVNDVDGNATDDLTFWGAGGVKAITVKATSGNVGIGTTDPGTSRATIYSDGLTNDKVLKVTGSGVAGGQSGPFYGLYVDALSNNNATARYGIYAYGDGGGGGPNYGVYGATKMDSSTRLAAGVMGHVLTNSGATNNDPTMATPVAGVIAIASTTGTSMLAVTTALLARNETVYGATSYGAYIDAIAGPTTVVPLRVDYNTSEIMRVTSSGRVGIGTTSPGTKLDVSGAIRGTTGLTLTGDAAKVSTTYGGVTATNFFTDAGGGVISVDGSNAISLRQGGVSGTDALTILGNGNVGISTGVPQARLDISGDGSTILLPRKSATGNPSGSNGMMYYNTADAKFRCYQAGAWTDCVTSASGDNLGNHTATTDLNMASQAIFNASSMTITGAGVSGASPIFTVAGSTLNILANGNVGIGTAGPGAKLHVIDGAAALKFQSTSQSNLLMTGPNSTLVINADAATSPGIALQVNGATRGLIQNNGTNGLSFAGDWVSPQMVLTTLGNVGIGTTSPGYKLTVNGSAQIMTGENLNFQNVAGNGNSVIANTGTGTNKELRFDTGVTGALFIQNGGNVGIGRTGPANKVEIDATGGKGIQFFTADNGYSDRAGIIYAAADTGAYGQGRITIQGIGAGNTLIDTLTVKAGNVGIGTTAPGYKLEIANAVAADVALTATGAGGSTWRMLSTDNSASISGGKLGFNNGSYKMVIDTNGNVGIGTTSPGAQLDVQTALNAAGVTTSRVIAGTTGSLSTLSFFANGYSNAAADRAYIDSTSDGNAKLGLRVNSDEKVTILNNGNVGIGTTGPGEKLEVNGKVFITDGGNSTIPSLKIGVTGTGLSYPNTNTLSLLTNSATRMTIDGSGNVGIGTTGPLGRLDIKGSGPSYLNGLNLVDNANAAKTSMLHTAGSLFLGIATNASGADAPGDFEQRLRIYEPTVTATDPIVQIGDPDITILQNGNVGIGTTGPLGKAHIYESGTAVIAGGSDAAGTLMVEGPNYAFNTGGNPVNFSVVSNAAVAADTGGTIGLGAKYNGNAWAEMAFVKSGKNNATAGDFGGYLSLGTRANGQNVLERVRIDSAGNVGIGTTNPGYKLEVTGDARIARTATQAADTGITITAADFGKTITVNSGSAQTVTLPAVTAADIGATITVVKLGAGNVTIQAAASTYIADSSSGGSIVNNTAAQTYASITLRLATSTKWVIVGGDGSWTTN